jgi:hypothetical protein
LIEGFGIFHLGAAADIAFGKDKQPVLGFIGFLSHRIAWHRSEEPAEARRKTPGSIPQFLRALVHARSRSTPHTVDKCPGNYPRASMIGRKCSEQGRQVGQFQQIPNPKSSNP